MGQEVETSGHGFYEGVWDGDFPQFRPDLSSKACGSGMVMTEAGPTFVPNSFPGEPIFTLLDRVTGDAVVSNSLMFALVAAGVLPGEADFAALTRDIRDNAMAIAISGMERAQTLLAEDSRYALHMVNFFTFRLEGTQIRRHWTMPRREFRTYGQYRDLLSETLRDLLRNGAHPQRRQQLQPIVPISRGYDSVACAAVAAQVGCVGALTLDVTVEGRHDSGEANARALDLDVSVHRHPYGDDLSSLDVGQLGAVADTSAEFIATAGRPGNIIYQAFAHRLRGSILISGAGGDVYWPRELTATSGYGMRS